MTTLTAKYTAFLLGGEPDVECSKQKRLSHDAGNCKACKAIVEYKQRRDALLATQSHLVTLTEWGDVKR